MATCQAQHFCACDVRTSDLAVVGCRTVTWSIDAHVLDARLVAMRAWVMLQSAQGVVRVRVRTYLTMTVT